MSIYLPAYLILTVIFLAIDALWLGVILKSFIQEELGSLLKENINFPIAALFYIFYTAGLTFFALRPAIDQNSILIALLYGAFLGFLCYGTYEFTNFATLKDWSIKFMLVDLLWGTFLSATATALTYVLVKVFINQS